MEDWFYSMLFYFQKNGVQIKKSLDMVDQQSKISMILK